MLIAPSTYYEHVDRQPSHRQLRDESLKADIERVHTANYGVYGARKVWLALNRAPPKRDRLAGRRLPCISAAHGVPFLLASQCCGARPLPEAVRSTR